MTRPSGEAPIGMELWNVVSAVHRAFDEALSAAGGSRPVWSILLSLKTRPVANQRELAESVGIQGATLTHHLTAMEEDGLLTRRRDPNNRRVHLVELTEAGEDAFGRMARAATAFDACLRAGIPDAEIKQLRKTLATLRANATSRPPQSTTP